MHPFSFSEARNVADAVRQAASQPGVRFLAGGTNLVDLMKAGPENPPLLIDINPVEALTSIEVNEAAGVLRLGALARMSDVAAHADVRKRFPALSESLLFAASGQLRNMASVGGNLLQRTRCYYFRDRHLPCNKREPGSGCGALDGENRHLAVLGTSRHCIANYPGDFAVALAALDGVVHTTGINGDRAIPAAELHRLPGDTPHIETVLEPGELITALEVPFSRCAQRSHYLKIRDRQSFEFASVSVAAAAETDSDLIVRQARLALGGLATRPWRTREAEALLAGHRVDDVGVLAAVADAALDGAQPQSQNAFKIVQAKAAIRRAFETVAQMASGDADDEWSTA